MNFFKKLYCRTFQTAFKIALPFLPYREPKVLTSNEEIALLLIEKQCTKPLIVTDKGLSNLGLANPLKETLSKQGVEYAFFDETVPNPTTDNIHQAVELYKSSNCNSIIAFGGGSSMDCAKGVGAKIAKPNKSLAQMKGLLKVGKKLPLLIAIPTTAGTGSETTLAAVITDSKTHHKYVINDFNLIPHYALLDASLTQNLPKHITSTTGMDALTHAVEAFIGNTTTTSTRKHSLNAVKLIFENLKEVYDNGNNLEARQKMLHASYLAGLAFTKSYVGYCHAIAHTLGGKYNLPHGLANAIILPYILKAYGKKIHKKLWKLGTFANLFPKETSYETGAKLFIEAIENLNKHMNIESSIPAIQNEDIKSLAKTADAEANPLYPVPVLFDAKELETIYHQIKTGNI
ncbi:MAG: iron-containing alcohol dehydrogenase [Clostridia bacterium]|nr:iron-containing alcohol dehydrogenase [Clostridia bacterium]